MSKNIVISDLDGTLASCGWRKHYIDDPKKKDWKAFFAGIPFDAVIPDVLRRLREYDKEGYDIIYLTARPESCRRDTQDWLAKHNCPRGRLIMRSNGDHRRDVLVKEDALVKLIGPENVKIMFDDNEAIQKMVESYGIEIVKAVDPNIDPPILKTVQSDYLDVLGSQLLKVGGGMTALAAGHGNSAMIALYPPPDIAKKMAVSGGEPINDLHVTLVFLGNTSELPPDFKERATSALKKVCAKQPPLSGEFSGIGRFVIPDGDAVYASVDVVGLSAFRYKLCQQLEAEGVPYRKDHDFTPHCTLVYLRDGKKFDLNSNVRKFDVEFKSAYVVIGDVDRTEVEFTGNSK